MVQRKKKGKKGGKGYRKRFPGMESAGVVWGRYDLYVNPKDLAEWDAIRTMETTR